MAIKIFSRFCVPESKGLSCGIGMTQQHFKNECDINTIIRNYNPLTPVPTPVFGDFTVSNLQDAYDIVFNAQSTFDGLPSDLRQRFNNNPVELFSFLENEKNYDEAVSLGLIEKPRTMFPQEPIEAVSPPEDSPSA